MKALKQMKNLMLAAGIIMLLLMITCMSVYAGDEGIKQSNISAKDKAGASVVISGSCGYNLTWTLDDEGILVISGTGSMTSASSSTDSPFYGILSSIKSIVIEDGVTTVGSCAFYGCTTLESLTMADSITSIGEYAFYGCSKLTDFILSDNLKTIGDKSFYDCENLTSVTIPESIVSIGDYAFYYCSLKNVVLPDVPINIGSWAFNSALSEDDYGAYYIGKHLIRASYEVSGSYMVKAGTLDIASFSISSQTELKSVTIPDSVKIIGSYAFYNCTALTNVTMGNGVERIGESAFKSCTSFYNIVIPDSVTSIGSLAFYNTSRYNNIGSGWQVFYIGKHLIDVNESFSGSFTVSKGTLTIANYAFSYCDDIVSIKIPDSVRSIGEGAFYQCSELWGVYIDDLAAWCEIEFENSYSNPLYYASEGLYLNGSAVTDLVIPEGVTAIKDYTFRSCINLKSVTVPKSVTSIDPYAFTANRELVFNCYINSCADEYAKGRDNITVKYICDGCVFTNYISDGNTTCTEDGTMTAYCDNGCGKTNTVIEKAKGHSGEWNIITEVSCTTDGVKSRTCTLCGVSESETYAYSTGHSWSSWIVLIAPTETTEGEQLRYCSKCKLTEKETIPVVTVKDPVLTSENYFIYITEANEISHIRYAKGVYTSSSDIKNASDCVDLSSSVIAKNTVDGILEYAMADGGVYSLWIKMSDGRTYIMTADLSIMEQEVEVYGVTVTLKNLYGVRDYFIAKGSHSSYSDVKANSVVQITRNKIGTKHDFEYILTSPGTYTVCIRYDDSSREYKFITFEAEVSEPVFTGNGLQLTVGNLEDIKVIRTAYGEYATPGDVKRAAGARAFTGKSLLKGLDEYTIQYRENGTVTVAVVYNNGYEVMYTYEVAKKVPFFVNSGRSVVIGELDGLNLVRYAKGKYTSSNQIKNAPGSKVVKSDAAMGGYIIIELDPGTYSFCVQYDDESYNYYIITVS